MELDPEVEQHLAGLSDCEWSALSARLRAPDTAEEFRSAAAKHVSDDQLDSLVNTVNLAAFVGADGRIDEAKVERSLAALFGQGGGQRDWGQHSAPASPGRRPGDAGRAEAQRRFGTPYESDPAAVAAIPRPSAAGAAEAARRFGPKD